VAIEQPLNNEIFKETLRVVFVSR